MSIFYFLFCKYVKKNVPDENWAGILALIDVLILTIVGVATFVK